MTPVQTRRTLVAAWVALALLVPTFVLTIAFGLGTPAPRHATPATELTDKQYQTLPAWTAELYRYAADHATAFDQLPCFCGCDRTLGHRSLRDCFVTATGAWARHAAGCGVCTTEALDARTSLDAGAAPVDIRAHLVSTYGPTSTTGSPR